MWSRWAYSSQNKVAEYGYNPYGQTYTNTGTMAGTNPYRYIDAFQDLGTSGLYKMGARYYNESTGRFTQPDPSGQETNRYNYANSNPVTYTDSTGLNWLADTAGYLAGGAAALLSAPLGPVAAGFIGGFVGGFVGNAANQYLDDTPGGIDYGDAALSGASAGIIGGVGGYVGGKLYSLARGE